MVAQRDIDDVGKGQPIGVAFIFNRQNIFGLSNDFLSIKKAHGQLVVVSRRTHDHSKAAVVDAHFKRLLNGESVLARLVLLFLPMSNTSMHDALWVKWRSPVTW